MRVFVDAHVFDDLSQGSKTYLNGLYTSVLAVNLQDDFYFASNQISSVTKEFGTSLNVHALQYRSHSRVIRLGWNIPQLIQDHKIDWAHFQYISPARKTCAEIVTIHDLLFLDFPDYFPRNYRLARNFLFRRSAKRADWVLTVSEFSKNALMEYYDLDEEKIIITPNGILDFFWKHDNGTSDIGIKHNLKRFVLYVSRFEPRKNQLGLLDAYLKLELWKQEIQLVFVGGVGIQNSKFQMRYNSLDDKLKKCILVLEELSLRDLKWLYEKCELFVYPSFAEGFGIPPLEALACNANVICSNTTAMSEFRFLGDRLFDPNNQNKLIEKIEFYLKNPGSGKNQALQEYVKAHYSWDTAAKKFLGIFT